jgi:hypothetical protein
MNSSLIRFLVILVFGILLTPVFAETVVPAGAPYHLETVLTNDVLEVFVVNDKPDAINVKFTFTHITGANTDWPLSGAKNCDPQARVLICAFYKTGDTRPAYDLSTVWTTGRVTIPVPTPTPSTTPKLPHASANVGPHHGPDLLALFKNGTYTCPDGTVLSISAAGVDSGTVPSGRSARMEAFFHRGGGHPEKVFPLCSFSPGPDSPVIDLPFPAGVSSLVGQGYNGPTSHGGTTAIDFYLPVHTPVVAAFDAVVMDVKDNGRETSNSYASLNFSNNIRIAGQYMHAVYGHLDINGGIVVKPGQHVKAGEVIGYSGKTGGMNIRPHLHFETSCYDTFNNEPVMVPIPTWFNTSEGKTEIVAGKTYSR